MGSVLRDWVMELPLKEQATLLTAVRGCDEVPKYYLGGSVIDSPERRIVAWVRAMMLNPACPEDYDSHGGFMCASHDQATRDFRPDQFGHLPQHWYAHLMHAIEIIAYRHPDGGTGNVAYWLYEQMVKNLHLNVETHEEMVVRLAH